MTDWHPITAKFSSEEKIILDKLRDLYGLNYNQSLKIGIEIFSRLIALGEFYATIDNETMKKIRKIGNKYTKKLEAEIKEILKTIPEKKLEEQYEELSTGITKIFSKGDKIFDKNRKRGRKSINRKRGRPKDLGKTS